MSSMDTMMLLGSSFIELAEHEPLDKISVSDIVAASNKNRKTFYYHFDGKDSLAQWIFRRDMADVLTQSIKEDELVHEDCLGGRFPALPYYMRRKSGVRSLDGSVFIEMLATCLQNRRSFYAKLLRKTGPESLREYLKELYVPAMADDIRFILSNRYLAECNIRFLSEFYVGAIVTYVSDKLCDPICTDILADIKPFQNIVHSSLESEIKKQQLKHVL